MRPLLLSFLVLFGLSRTLAATVILPAEFREIVSGSQLIVHGRVVDLRSEWVEGRSRIDTFVTIEAATFYRGSPAPTITFRTPGGEVGHHKSIIVGAPQFRVGDEAVLFLKTDSLAGPQIFGLNQGLFRVRVDPRTGRRLVVRHVLVSQGSGSERVMRGDRDRRPLTLDAFGALVRSTLQQEPAR